MERLSAASAVGAHEKTFVECVRMRLCVCVFNG